jgi:hypothetical protein
MLLVPVLVGALFICALDAAYVRNARNAPHEHYE